MTDIDTAKAVRQFPRPAQRGEGQGEGFVQSMLVGRGSRRATFATTSNRQTKSQSQRKTTTLIFLRHTPFSVKKGLIAAVVISLLCTALGGCSDKRVLEQHEKLYLQVIERLKTGELKTGGAGDIQLPPELRSASVDGEVCVSQPSTNQMIVVFKTWRGKGANMEGFLYSEKPLSEDEIGKDYYGSSVIPIAGIEIVLEHRITPNWYRVNYRLD